jgi:peptidoglycan/LPS O-acetylase OafA/YrhL
MSRSEPVAVPPHLLFVEGLRALAALWVILSHAWLIQYGVHAQPGWRGWAFNWLIYSHFAVDIFIVLSGFCLALPLVWNGTLRGGAKAFWKRRARRILPPCYLSLVYAVAVSVLLHYITTHVWHLDFEALAVNVLLLQDLVLRDDIFNGPLWSIAVECRMYLVFPLLAWVMQRSGRGALLLLAGIVGYALTALIFRYAPHLLLSCPWYLLLFALGMCAASVSAPRQHGSGKVFPLWPVVLPTVGVLAWLLWRFPVTAQNGTSFGLHMPLTDAAVGVLAAALLVALCRREHREHAAKPTLLVWPPLVMLGQFSYSLYLTHDPTLRALNWLMNQYPPLEATSGLLKFALLVFLGLPMIVGLAYGFFFVCERPFLNSHTRILALS